MGSQPTTPPGRSSTYQDKLYYNIQYYLLTGNTTASNYIESYYNNQTYLFTNTFRYEASGFVVNNGQIWLASYFMSYIIATNRPTDPTIVAYFKQILQAGSRQRSGFRQRRCLSLWLADECQSLYAG